MRISGILILACLSTTCVAQTQPFFVEGEDPKPNKKAWEKIEVLSDEFNGPVLDTNKWTADPAAKGWGWIGRPPGLFTPKSVTVQDGKLRITVGKLDAPKVIRGNEFKYHGAIIRSINPCRVGWYYECRMKANQTEMSSTFWLMTDGSVKERQELDIQECVGRLSKEAASWSRGWNQIFHSNLIKTTRGEPGKVQIQGSIKTETKNSERFYVYGAWWKSPHEIRFYLDGKYAYSLKPPVAWDTPKFYQMAIETYDWNPVPDDGGLIASGTWDERTTQYDWVRTWKLK